MLCAAALGLALWPVRVAPPDEPPAIGRVQRVTDGAVREDITAQLDRERLAAQLAACERARLPFYQTGYALDAVRYEIDALCDERPLHLVLGEGSFVYESAPWNYRLRDAQPLIAALDAAMATKEKD